MLTSFPYVLSVVLFESWFNLGITLKMMLYWCLVNRHWIHHPLSYLWILVIFAILRFPFKLFNWFLEIARLRLTNIPFHSLYVVPHAFYHPSLLSTMLKHLQWAWLSVTVKSFWFPQAYLNFCQIIVFNKLFTADSAGSNVEYFAAWNFPNYLCLAETIWFPCRACLFAG